MTVEVACRYDDGLFDKDEGGWVSKWVEVTTDAHTGVVHIRHSGAPDVETKIAKVFGSLVKFEDPRWYFDLSKSRLIDATQSVVLHRATVSGDWSTTARVNDALALSLQLFAQLAGAPGAVVPAFIAWPPRTGLGRFDFTIVTQRFVNGLQVELRWRPPINETASAELVTTVSRDAVSASVVVTERNELWISVVGALEHHHLTAAVISAAGV